MLEGSTELLPPLLDVTLDTDGVLRNDAVEPVATRLVPT